MKFYDGIVLLVLTVCSLFIWMFSVGFIQKHTDYAFCLRYTLISAIPLLAQTFFWLVRYGDFEEKTEGS